MKHDVIEIKFTRRGLKQIAWVMFADAHVVRASGFTKNGAVRKALRLG